MSTIGTSSSARASTSSRVPTQATRPSSMRRASATGGSSIVTMRPTMTRSPRPGPAGPAGAVGVRAPPAGHDVDLGEFVPPKAQPAARATTMSAANSEPNPLRDAGIWDLPARVSTEVGPLAHRSSAEHGPVTYSGRPEGRVLFNPPSGERAGGRRGRPLTGLDQANSEAAEGRDTVRAAALSRRRPWDAVAPSQGPPRTMPGCR